jgi:hypothetical protein
MRRPHLFAWLADSQQRPGLWLRFETLVPFTLFVFIAGGRTRL